MYFMIKTAFIIPDWQTKTSSTAYVNTVAAFKTSGYTVMGQDFTWTSGTVEKWAYELIRALHEQKNPSVVCAVGLGAMIALAASAKEPIEKLILCSPKGYFREYVQHPRFIPARWMGEYRLKEFSTLTAAETLKNIQVGQGQIILDQGEFIGRPEHKQWMDDLMEYTGWEATAVSHTAYGIMGPGYQRTMVNAAKTGAASDTIEG
jgi:pimeloyl-ACP methyl ester carboxylesterase